VRRSAANRFPECIGIGAVAGTALGFLSAAFEHNEFWVYLGTLAGACLGALLTSRLSSGTRPPSHGMRPAAALLNRNAGATGVEGLIP
jgi:hypothetical protein